MALSRIGYDTLHWHSQKLDSAHKIVAQVTVNNILANIYVRHYPQPV